MMMPVNHQTWQMLRAVLREDAGAGVPGRRLRLVPNRRTRDGTFLDVLVRDGLLRAVGRSAEEEARDPKLPPQFYSLYALTPAGAYAAEHGEYDVPV